MNDTPRTDEAIWTDSTGVRVVCASVSRNIEADFGKVVRELATMTAERDYLRTKLSTPGHAHIDGAHLSGLVDGCLLCDAMKERDRLRADLSLASGHADALREQLRQVTTERDKARAENEGLRAVHAAALNLVRAPAWAGVSDEDCELERALLELIEVTK